jgi:hypothetical protein
MWAVAPFDAPDEPAHLLAIMEVRKGKLLPQFTYDPGESIDEMIEKYGDPEVAKYVASVWPSLTGPGTYNLVPYESTQPPLYYIAAGVAANLVPADPQAVLYVGRLVAVIFGAAAVYFCWLAAREIAPQAPLWVATSVGAIVLLPQYCFNSASANNDSTAQLACAAAYFVWFKGLRQPGFDKWMVGAGAMLGLALLSKLTTVALIPGLLLLIIFRTLRLRTAGGGTGEVLRHGLLLVLGATAGTLLVCSWWLVRNLVVYGEPTGMASILDFYQRVAPGKADFSIPSTTITLLDVTLQSTWGRFGWNEIALPAQLYQIVNLVALVLLGLSLFATIRFLWIEVRSKRLSLVLWQAAVIFAVMGIVLLFGFVRFNATIAIQPQGRYFFILLLPAALFLTVGLYAFTRPGRPRVIAMSGLLLILAALNAISLAFLHSVS